MSLRHILICAMAVLATSCSFTKKEKEKELALSPVQVEAQNKALLLPLITEDNTKKLEIALSRLDRSKINSSWGKNENLLSSLIKVGSKERLDLFIKNGLSIYLPYEENLALNNGMKSRFLKEFGSATSQNYAGELSDSSNEAFNFIKEMHIQNVNSIYSLLKKGSLAEAKRITLSLNIPCWLISESIILRYQLDTEASNFPLIKSYLADLRCDTGSLSKEQSNVLWRFEIQRQFLTEFSDSSILAYLFHSNKSLPYLLSIGSSDIFVGIKSLYEVAKVCSFFSTERAKLGNVSCHEDPLESYMDEIEGYRFYHVIPSTRFELYNTWERNNTVRHGDIEAENFLNEVGISSTGGCDLLKVSNEQVQLCQSPISISSIVTGKDSEGTIDSSKNRLPRSIYRMMYGFSPLE